MKFADSVLLSLFMTDNEKCNNSHAHRTGFKRDILFWILRFKIYFGIMCIQQHEVKDKITQTWEQEP